VKRDVSFLGCSYRASSVRIAIRTSATSTVKPPRQTSPQAHADEQHKHHMNQIVVYKKTA